MKKKPKQKQKKQALLFVTSNRHKFSEVRAILAPFGIRLRSASMDFTESNCESLACEALSKAMQAFAKFKCPLIVEDTGFYFNAYRTFPGTQPKRMFEALGYDGFFRLLKGQSRAAYAETAICLIQNKKKHTIFTGRLNGTITDWVLCRHKDVMPYERVFIPRGEKRVLAHMSRTEKNAISHRAIAARKLARFLLER